MTKTIIHIAPALTNQSGQCRVYKLDVPVDAKIPNYRDNRDIWAEAGLMNSRGKLVCFDGTTQQRNEIVECEPLMAGLVFVFNN